MGLYRKKPVVIEAAQLRKGECPQDALINDGVQAGILRVFKYGALIATPEGDMVATHGDWIIRGVKGELYPVKPDIFEATYEPVTS